MKDVLKLLEKDCRLTPKQIAAMLGRDEGDIRDIIEKCEQNSILLGYKALIDWDKVSEEIVTALIEVKIAPQRGYGFDRIAERIYQYDEVESMYLTSGGFDFTVIITGRTLKEVAMFISQRLSPIEGVLSTTTHFILKKYKEKHTIFAPEEEQKERPIFV